MTNDDIISSQSRESRIALYQSGYAHLLQLDRAGVDTGVFILKMVMTLNAGALIALMTTTTLLAGAPGAILFFSGLIVAALAAFLALVGQGMTALKLANDFSGAFSDQRETSAISSGYEIRTPCSLHRNDFGIFLVGLVQPRRLVRNFAVANASKLTISPRPSRHHCLPC